jgi:hypothetical protein
VTERSDLTEQGYRRFRCRDCDKQFNERSDGVLNRASLPSDIIAFVVFCRLRYRLTLRDLSEIMLLRGFTISHESIRRWESKLLPVMGEALRKRRYGIGRISGQSWYADETYLKVHGRWCYLYRAIDRDGNLIDTLQPIPSQSVRSSKTPTPTLSSARPHRDGHHADRIIRRFRQRDALQTARDVTEPELFISGDPGTIITGSLLELCRTWRNQEEITVRGKHFLQEDSPHDIGRAIARWLARLPSSNQATIAS